MICRCFSFSFLSKQKGKKKNGHGNPTPPPPPPKNNCRKQNMFSGSAVFTIVFHFFSLGVGLKNANVCRKRYKIVVSTYFATTTNGPKVSNLKSKTGPNTLRNIIGPMFDFENVQFWPSSFFYMSLSLQKEEIFENKKDSKKLWTNLTFKKQNLDLFLTLQHIYIYIHIYIYAGESVYGPPFSNLKVSLWSTFFLSKICATSSITIYPPCFQKKNQHQARWRSVYGPPPGQPVVHQNCPFICKKCGP